MTAAGPPGIPTRGRHWWSLAPVPPSRSSITVRRAYGEALGVYLAFFGPSIVVAAGVLGGYRVTNPEGWWVTGSDGFDQIARAGLAVVVVVLLAGRRGRGATDLGLVATRAKGGPGIRVGIRMAAWAALVFLVGGIVTSVLASGSFPFGRATAANTVLDLTAALNAGVTEEIVVLAFLVTTLEHAGRPRTEIAVVALVCRGAYHIYYGPGALGILVWAAVFLWLFWRFRSVVPMLLTHVGWDTLVFLGRLSPAFSVLLVLLILALLITALVLWLVDRSAPTGAGPYWDPDPPRWGAPVAPLRPAAGTDPPVTRPPYGAWPDTTAGGWGPPVGHPARRR